MEIEDLPDDPLELVRQWREEARAREHLPEAMALATVPADGRPSNRFVLLKDVDARGFIFFSNYRSRKGQELEQNTCAAAAIFWYELHRQLRVEGKVERLTTLESDEYFASRDRLSQISARISPQSQVVSSRQFLENAVRRLEKEYAGREVERPAHWGGYRIVAEAIELWIGRDNRLHDRFRYRRDADVWIKERLAP